MINMKYFIFLSEAHLIKIIFMFFLRRNEIQKFYEISYKIYF